MKKIWNWLLIENNRKTLAFLGTGFFVIVSTIWTYFTYKPSDVATKMPTHNIGATWREIHPNPGSTSLIVQDGNTFRFIVKGTIQGLHFQSGGRGSINGVNIESDYESTIPSTGHCSGIISSDGMKTRSTCIDSVNGTFETVWVRQ